MAEEEEAMELGPEQGADDSQSEDSSDEDSLEDEKSQEKIRLYRKQLSEYPKYYDAHVDLINTLRDSGELLEARKAREDMNKHYPLSPELWLSWIKDEQSVSSAVEEKAFVTSLLERAVKDYASVDVWTEYFLYSVGLGDLSVTRVVADKALSAVGTNVRDGDGLWQAVLMVETQMYAAMKTADEEGKKTLEQQEQLKRIQSLIKRRFRVPLLNMDATDLVTEAEQWFDGELEHYMHSDLKKSLGLLQAKMPFEQELLQTEDDPVSNVAAYQEYIASVRTKKEPAQLQNLYERAVLKHPVNEELWLDYVHWALQQFASFGDLLLPVTGRSLQNCPWSGELCSLHLHAIQRCHQTDDLAALRAAVKDVVESCLPSLTALDNTAMAKQASIMWNNYIAFLMRCIIWPQQQHKQDEELVDINPANSQQTNSNVGRSTENGNCKEETVTNVQDELQEQLRKVREAFRRALQMVRSVTPVACDSDISLWRVWAGMECKAGKLEDARQVWNEVLAQGQYAGRYDLWLEFIEMERREGSIKHVRKLYRRALERVWDNNEVIAVAFETFEQLHGDVHTIDDFIRRRRNRMIIVNKRREEVKAKEGEGAKTDKKTKQRGTKQQPQPQHATADDRTQHHKQDRSKTDKPQQRVTSSGAVVGHVADKRPLEDPNHESPAKRRKDAPTPPTAQELSTKVAVGQESRTVFVSNLDYFTSLVTVTSIFKDCGTIKDARLVKDFKGRSKGFGFVVFESSASMQEALKKDRSPIGSRPIFVSTYESDKKGHTFKYSTGVEKDKLFIKGLPYSMTEREVKEAFEVHAPVKEIRLVTHRNGYSKGTCFIKFTDAATAENVRKAMDQTELRGFTITVMISNPSESKQTNVCVSGANSQQSSAYTLEQKRHGGKGANNEAGPSFVGQTRRPTLAFMPRALAKPRTTTAVTTKNISNENKMEKSTINRDKKDEPTINNDKKEEPTTNCDKPAEVNSASKEPSKSNDDFRKMMMK